VLTAAFVIAFNRRTSFWSVPPRDQNSLIVTTDIARLRRSALGQKRTSAHVHVMSALPPKADIRVRRSECTRKRSSAKQVGSWFFFAPKACHEKIARNAFAHPVLNSYIVMSCPKEIEGVGQCVIKALYLIKGLGA